MLPAQQRFEPGDLARVETDDRLVVHAKSPRSTASRIVARNDVSSIFWSPEKDIASIVPLPWLASLVFRHRGG